MESVAPSDNKTVGCHLAALLHNSLRKPDAKRCQFFTESIYYRISVSLLLVFRIKRLPFLALTGWETDGDLMLEAA